VEDVDRLWAAGARSITVVHSCNDLAGASYGQFSYNLFNVKNTRRRRERLSSWAAPWSRACSSSA